MKRNLQTWLPALALLVLIVLSVPSPVHAQPPCQQAPNCIKDDNPGNSGVYTAPNTILDFVIKAGQNEFHFAPPGPHNDGCYTVSFSTVTYEKVGSGSECQDISHTETWYFVAPTGITLTSLTANGGRSPWYYTLGSILFFLIALGFSAWVGWKRWQRGKNQVN